MSKNWMRVLSLLLVGGFLLPALSGCNTMKGLGEDMEAAGEAIQSEADDDKE